MNLLAALLALLLSLVLQAAIGGWFPQAQGYLDVMLAPVAWYAIVGSQRSAMLVGCAAGLLHDAWFQAGVFGVHGFSKTLLGWTLGGLGTRFDLNHVWGRLLGGAFFFLADRLLEVGLLLLLDQTVAPLSPAGLAIGAAASGLLVAGVFAILNRLRGRETIRRPVRRRA